MCSLFVNSLGCLGNVCQCLKVFFINYKWKKNPPLAAVVVWSQNSQSQPMAQWHKRNEKSFSQRKWLKETNFSQREINDIRMVFIKSWTRRTNGEWRWYKRNWRIFIIIMSHLQSPRNGNTHNNNIQHKRKKLGKPPRQALIKFLREIFSFFFLRNKRHTFFLLPFLSFLLLSIFVFFFCRDKKKKKKIYERPSSVSALFIFHVVAIWILLKKSLFFLFFFILKW